MTPSDAQQALAHDAEQQRQRILNQPAGPELNVLVAEQVFGWQPAHDGLWRLPDGALVSRLHLPPSSTDPGAAMVVLEKFGWYEIRGVYYEDQGQWGVSAAVGQTGHRGGWDRAASMALAICRAALLATLEARPR